MSTASPLGAPQVRLGMGLMTLAWFFFACTDTTVKWLATLGLPALQLAFMRYFVALVLTVAAQSGVARQNRRKRAALLAAGGTPQALLRLTRPQITMLTLRALLLVSATVVNFIAIRYLSLTLIAAVMFSAPIFTCALSAPLLGEKVGPWRWGAILLGFVGVMIIVAPWSESFHWAAAMIVYNALAMAFFSILTRKLAGHVPALTMQMFLNVLGVCVLLPFAILTWQNPETMRDWLLLCIFGAFAWTGHELFSNAHRFAEASVLMPFQYSYILFMSAGSFFVFGDVPGVNTLTGAAVIIVAGLVIWWRENHA
ncbi:DMT family transporter [Pseudoruegeria sp. SHC-113]|uniref:DMT family transporter n=1 Tax=Pseudoruegeria sp. SHC-113 TaxID=2855439 RepID=UPI0021BAC67B|nr:DMT family transporter [Pseudoruegeria sp. SHC-113]